MRARGARERLATFEERKGVAVAKRWAVLEFAPIGALLLVFGSCAPKERPASDGRLSEEAARLDPDAERAGAGQGTEGEPGSVLRGPEGAESALGEEEAVDRLALGDSCAVDGDCLSGFCTDGVCCNARCGEVCASCAAAGSVGTCGPAASDPACDALSCPSATECRRYEGGGTENCDGFQLCRAQAVCKVVDEPEGAPCRGGAGTCDGLGECVVPDTAGLGETCGQDQDCGSGFCVTAPSGEAMCCESACDGVCEQCSPDGRCDAAPADDERCEAVQCQSDNVCLDYPDALTEDLCRARGQCRSAQDCQSEAVALRSAASCECDASGSCGLTRGTSCTSDAECASGACEQTAQNTSTCCAQQCGPGLICAFDGSRCVECEGDATQCEGDTAVSCAGGARRRTLCPNGCTEGQGCNDRAPLGATCAQTECQPGLSCLTDRSGARRCCSRNCEAEDKLCAEDGSCVCPEGQTQGSAGNCLLQQGDPCGAGTACGPGLTCVDGVCCDQACDGACESCNLAGSVGRCAYDERDLGLCPPGQQCAGRDDCRALNREACQAGADCLSANCEPQVGIRGARVCCAQACGGQRDSCSSNGSSCVECESAADCPNGCNNGLCNDLRRPGELCTLSDQCSTQACVRDQNDPSLSRCCPSCGAGQLCTSSGQCVNPPAGQGGACGAGRSCAVGLTCVDGTCCESSCTGVCEQCNAQGVCQQLGGAGGCPQGQQCQGRSSCVPIPAEAGESCARGEQCVGLGVSCIAGTCRPRCTLAGNANSSDPAARLDLCVLQ